MAWIIFLVYVSTGLIWYFSILIHNRPKFNAFKLLVGALLYSIIFPVFLMVNLKKLRLYKRTLKPFKTYKLILFNDYKPLDE